MKVNLSLCAAEMERIQQSDLENLRRSLQETESTLAVRLSLSGSLAAGADSPSAVGHTPTLKQGRFRLMTSNK